VIETNLLKINSQNLHRNIYILIYIVVVIYRHCLGSHPFTNPLTLEDKFRTLLDRIRTLLLSTNAYEPLNWEDDVETKNAQVWLSVSTYSNSFRGNA
jgi:hypothetical protein